MGKRRGSPDRTDYIRQLVGALGSNVVTITDLGDGWPGMLKLQTAQGDQNLAVYIALVNPMYTGEQNPTYKTQRTGDYKVLPPGGRPVGNHKGAITLALGWTADDTPPVVVACDPNKWQGARSSQMVKLDRIREAQVSGWSTYQNKKEETFHRVSEN